MKKTGYSTTTYKLRLYCQHREWLWETKEMYNLVLRFYYEVLQKEPELAGLPSRQQILRRLELLTVGARGQGKESVEYPLPYGKVPLYFRRAAINDAIRLMRSYLTGSRAEGEGVGGEAGRASLAREFHASPIFYKGMYRDFKENEIFLKLWNGERWVWERCGLECCGRTMPEAEKLLSPVLKLEGKMAMLHVPVVQEVEDVRTVQERFLTEDRICAAAFPGSDCMAVLVVLNKDGDCMESLFLRGGKQLANEKKKLLNRIRKNRGSMGTQAGTGDLPEDENKHLKEKIRNLTDTYAHRISRQIVDFCEEKGIRILAVPHYTQGIDLNAKGYLSAASYDWLGRRIIQYLRYKAFAKGIVVASVSPKGIAGTCYLCGESVKRFNKNNKPSRNYYGGKNYICPNGHQGNAHFNTAMNVGRRLLWKMSVQAGQKSSVETSG